MTENNAGDRAARRRKLRVARDAALAGAGVAGAVGAGVVTHKAVKAVDRLSKRGRAAIRAGLKSSKGLSDTAKDVLDKNVRPAVNQIREATQNSTGATRILSDVGDLYGRAKKNLKSDIPGAFKSGLKEGLMKPRVKSLASRAGKLARKVGFNRPYGKDVTELSSFVADVTLSDLPPIMRKTVSAFGATKTSKMPRYGIVVKELVSKADPVNLATARSHVKGLAPDALGVEFEKARGKKFILLLNDRIIDGHHHLAKAERLNVTSALDVLDLTPVRFQTEVREMTALLKRVELAQASGREERVKQALLYGTGGAYLGGLLAGGKPMKIPVPSKLVKKLGGRVGRGKWKKVSVNAARAGAASGVVGGLAMNPKKRKKGGVGQAVIEHAPGLVTATQSFEELLKMPVTELGLRDLLGSNVKRAEAMLTRQKILAHRMKSRQTVQDIVKKNLTRKEAADPVFAGRVANLRTFREGVATNVRRRSDAVVKAKTARRNSRKTAAAFVGGAVVGAKTAGGRKQVEPVKHGVSLSELLKMPVTAFGSGDQVRERATGRQGSAMKAYADPSKYGRLKRDVEGKVVKDKVGRAIYDDLKDIPGVDVIKSAHRAAAPVVKWGGRGKALVSDAVGAVKGEVKRDKAGRVQKREWEKPWAQREGKKIVVGAGMLAYAAGMHKNTPLPIPSSYLRKIGAKAGKKRFTDIGLRDLHNGTVRTVRRKLNEKSKKVMGSQLFPDQEYAMLEQMITRLDALSEAQYQREVSLFEKPFSGYNEKRHAKTGGLNDRFRESYNRETGSNLKRPVTTAPSKLKPGSKAQGRRKSFCARMGGMPGATSKGGELTPKGAALKRWNCEASQIVTALGYGDARTEGWDVRDPRGKSARVFAPGSRRRERREKYWHERLGNERKLWGAGAIAAGLTGAAIGRKLVKRGGKIPTGATNVIKGNFTKVG